MKDSRKVKTVLFALVYGLNLFFALSLRLCDNIMLGILLIVFYRLSLWLAPLAVTVICWLPLKPKVPARKKLLFNLVHLLLSGLLFVASYLLFGNWF